MTQPVPDYITERINTILLDYIRKNVFYSSILVNIPYSKIDVNLTESMVFSIIKKYTEEGWKVCRYNIYERPYTIIKNLQFEYAK